MVYGMAEWLYGSTHSPLPQQVEETGHLDASDPVWKLCRREKPPDLARHLNEIPLISNRHSKHCTD